MRTPVFSAGVVLGAALAAASWLLAETSGATARDWSVANLGSARWLFLMTALAWFGCISALLAELEQAEPGASRVHALDQAAELCANLFVGIGVIWTAIGMRDALQAALGGSGSAQSADAVLRALVDGGILLALSTTIVGGIGGYLFRLGRALLADSAVHQFRRDQQSELNQLLEIAQEIRAQMRNARTAPESSP